ncbi:DUF423 domain-containing protein [Magnetovibrio sp. PR-2]|uniref:DUF423 domain-containing protein n=1 Tax=Magnetovibrio sp. PR-2 TaxID=3120356 RepID=UPI002FCE1556
MNTWLLLAGLNAALAVAAGAYGWHSLGDTPDIRDIFMMGSQYQMWHALGLMGVGLMIRTSQPGWPTKALHVAGASFMLGIFLFSGTLYSFGELMIVPVEGAAPFGGVLLMLGWVILGLVGGLKLKRT